MTAVHLVAHSVEKTADNSVARRVAKRVDRTVVAMVGSWAAATVAQKAVGSEFRWAGNLVVPWVA